MKNILILCTGNSCRSQMAEGILQHLLKDNTTVNSAGTKPCFVHPMAIKVMSEIGIDISNHRSKSVTEFIDTQIDIVITVCDKASEDCPIFPTAPTTYHWPFEDPAKTKPDNITLFRHVRDQIYDTMKAKISEGLAIV